MRIISNGIDFDLPSDFAVELTKYNEMLSDAGEQTAPVTIPDSPKNLKLCGYANRLDGYYKPMSDIDVMAVDGISSRLANLSINNPDVSAGINCTLYFGIANFYSRIKNKNLIGLNWGEVKHPNYATVSDEMRVNYLVALLKEIYETPANDGNNRFGVVPVLTSQEFTWRKNVLQSNETSYAIEDVPGLLILNGFEQHQTIIPQALDDYYVAERFEGEFDQVMIQDSAVISIGKGYGMTPFLKLRYILQTIFGQYGYEVDLSEIDNYLLATTENTTSLNNFLLLNNVADAIYGGKLEIKQLLPDIKISAFLDIINEKFAGKFVVNEVTRVAKFRMYDNVLGSNPVENLTQYKSGPVKPGAPEFKSLIISDGTGKNTDTEQTDTTTLQFTPMQQKVVEIPITAKGSEDVNPHIQKVIMPLVSIDGIIHVNTEVQIDLKTITETTNTSTNVQLICYDPSVLDCYNWLKFHRSYVPKLNDTKSMKLVYRKYIDFLKNSNIPGTVNMNIPVHVLEGLQLDMPVLIDNDPVLLEEIKRITNKPSECEVKFRTLRAYADR